MNTKNLEKLIAVLEMVNPDEFNMGAVINSSSKMDIIGHLWNVMNPNSIMTNVSIETMFKNAEEFTGLTMKSNAFSYLFSGYWRHELTNTIDHAIYRINSLLEEYEPEHITDEISSEIARLKE